MPKNAFLSEICTLKKIIKLRFKAVKKQNKQKKKIPAV